MDSGATGSNATGIKNTAPFLRKLAAIQPRVVMAHISLLLPYLESKQYMLWGTVRHILIWGDRVLVRPATEAVTEDKEAKEADPLQEEHTG